MRCVVEMISYVIMLMKLLRGCSMITQISQVLLKIIRKEIKYFSKSKTFYHCLSFKKKKFKVEIN